ncbi:MAG: GTP-binding protein [Halobacteriota archaeon]|nr:GTP-binding protein [Halobacteriota archaeon]
MIRKLATLVSNGESGNIEFKEFLMEKVHLSDDRRQGLACQMNHKMLVGNGTVLYVIGVTDDGTLRGIEHELYKETLSVLNCIAIEIGGEVADVETYMINEGYVGLVTIKNISSSCREHILVGTAGHVDHGKSTLVGSLVTGTNDDGAGKTRIYLDVKPHEIERGLSADLSYGVYGFKDEKPIYLKNPLSKKEKASVVERSEKLVSFVDTVGHEPWLRTTIRGIVGQKLDYGLLVVAADDGVTHVTKEHLGILLAMDLPTIIALTKIDRAGQQNVIRAEEEISIILKAVGRIPYKIKSKRDIEVIMKKNEGLLVPIIRTSPVTMEGLDLLNELFLRLPKRNISRDKPFQLYIDEVYQVSGVGTVVSGTVKQGHIKVGDNLNLGPSIEGIFTRVKVQSIEIHHYRVDEAKAGDIVGLALKGVKEFPLERGMVLCEGEPKAVREFEAEVMILNHPTRVRRGYEPVVHLETISEAVEFTQLEYDYMMAGQVGRVKMRFKFKPYFVYEGQKFIFREGHSKGIGKVLDATI